MNIYTALPQPILHGWTVTLETHPPGQAVQFHYHDVPEWLEVVRGGITFFTLSNEPLALRAGAVLNISRGEVHRADVGASGVDYRMFLPISVRTGFANVLSGEDVDLLRTNLEFPVREDNMDGSAPHFFGAHLSESLVFYRADGTIVDKSTYLSGFTARGRSSSGTIAVLNRTANTFLLSTVVVVGAGTPTAKSFTNLRVFVKETDGWKCRIWVNAPGAALT